MILTPTDFFFLVCKSSVRVAQNGVPELLKAIAGSFEAFAG